MGEDMYTFNDIAGNEVLIQSLKNAICHNAVFHAYIFQGENGLGKMTLAKAFAKALQCEEGNVEPCGKCTSCKTVDSGNHPDILYVKSTKGKSIGVEDIRAQVNKNMELKPFRYKYKIFIIEQAHTMTAQAQNALLKTIEEPSSFGIFMLLSENEKNFLPTMLSRCIIGKLNPPTMEQTVRCLIEDHGAGKDSAKEYAVFAQNNIGRALSYMQDNQFSQFREEAVVFLAHLYGKNQAEALTAARQAAQWKDMFADCLDLWRAWYRDLLVLLESGGEDYVMMSDFIQMLEREKEKYTVPSLCRKLDILWQAWTNWNNNGNLQMILDVLCLELAKP